MITERTVIVAKKEAGYGTDATPGTDDGILIYEPLIKPIPNVTERNPGMATLSQKAPVVGSLYYEFTGFTYLKGSGAAGTAPETSPLWQACGFSESVDAGTDVEYSLTSTGHESATIYAFVDGLKFFCIGCRGNVEIAPEAGGLARVNWTFQGLYTEPTDVSVLAGAAYDSQEPIACKGGTFTIDSQAFVAQAFSLNLNNRITPRASFSGAGVFAHGIAGIEITGRNPQGTFNPEALLVATYNLYNKWTTGNQGALNFVHGATAGNIATITAPKIVFREVNPGDRDGMAINDVPYNLAGNAGDDELVVTLS